MSAPRRPALRDLGPARRAAPPAEEAGQITLLTIGLVAVLVALVLVLLAVTTVHTQARTVQSLVDGAALAGSDELAFRLDQDPGVMLDPGTVDASVEAYLVAVGAHRDVPGLGAVASDVSADGATVTVRAEATVSLLPPQAAWAREILPLQVPVRAEGSSRTVLTR